MCLAVPSWTPSLCLQTRFVQPDLEVVKTAPDTAGMCEDIEVEYFVKNSGTGDLDTFEVQDELADGLMKAEGEQTLKFTVDGGLEVGESRKFGATLRASEAGEFSSRAVAIMPNEEKTRSAQMTTRIQQAVLAVASDGRRSAYVDRPLQYTVRVTNRSPIPARQLPIELNYPNSVQLARMGDVQSLNQAVQQSETTFAQTTSQPTPAGQDGQEQLQDDDQQASRDQNGSQSDGSQDSQRPSDSDSSDI